MAKLHYAQMFTKLGIAVIPLYHRNKKPDTSIIGGQWEQYSVLLPSACDLNNWFIGEWRNYGVVCGWNNLVVIDFDNIEYFNIWKLSASNCVSEIIDHAFKVRTSRGIHVYVTTMEPISNEKRISKKGGIDIQAQRKFVVGPGSIHPSGHVYEPIGEMVFPIVMGGIDDILPLDLFPRVVAEVEKGCMPVVEIAQSNTEYDPFAIASMSNDVDLITKVKCAIRIESLFGNVRKTSSDGRWLVTLCPFHDDHHPSMWIDTRRQLCGCATCGMKPMDAINLYSRMHNIPESVAVSQMAREVGVQ